MLTQKDNIVKIEGILSEVLLDKTSYKNKSGIDVPCIKGKIKVRVDQVINGENVTLEVPVSMFASEKKTDGTPNPGYQSVEKVMNVI
jgi:hypothetical protein